jgi:hypothetical protein
MKVDTALIEEAKEYKKIIDRLNNKAIWQRLVESSGKSLFLFLFGILGLLSEIVSAKKLQLVFFWETCRVLILILIFFSFICPIIISQMGHREFPPTNDPNRPFYSPEDLAKSINGLRSISTFVIGSFSVIVVLLYCFLKITDISLAINCGSVFNEYVISSLPFSKMVERNYCNYIGAPNIERIKQGKECPYKACFMAPVNSK